MLILRVHNILLERNLILTNSKPKHICNVSTRIQTIFEGSWSTLSNIRWESFKFLIFESKLVLLQCHLELSLFWALSSLLLKYQHSWNDELNAGVINLYLGHLWFLVQGLYLCHSRDFNEDGHQCSAVFAATPTCAVYKADVMSPSIKLNIHCSVKENGNNFHH